MIPVVPIRTPLEDASGNISRPWILFFQQIGSVNKGAGLLADLPQLGKAAAGYTYEATDYGHTFVWSGSAWSFSGNDASGYVVIGKPDGTAPNGGLWGLCDGSAYEVAQPDGTLASVTTQNLTGGAFIKGDTVAAQQAATVPTLTSGVLLSSDTGGGNTFKPAATGTTITVAAHPHSHTVTDAVIAAPSETAGGLPLRVGVVFYIRR